MKDQERWKVQSAISLASVGSANIPAKCCSSGGVFVHTLSAQHGPDAVPSSTYASGEAACSTEVSSTLVCRKDVWVQNSRHRAANLFSQLPSTVASRITPGLDSSF